MVETTCAARDVNPIKAERRTAEAGLKGFHQTSGAMERIGRKLIAVAEDPSEDQYDYKTTPDSSSFIKQLRTFSGRYIFFTDTAQGKRPRYDDNPKRNELKTKAEA